jgi:hypothetical protein
VCYVIIINQFTVVHPATTTQHRGEMALLQNITQLENDLWEAADQLRANSKLTATEYSLPVLGLIFLRHATNRYLTVKAEIEKSLPSRGGRPRPLTAADFQQKAAIYLPEAAQYEYLVNLSGQQLNIWHLDRGKNIAQFTTDGEIVSCVVAPDGTIIVGDGLGRVHFLNLVEPT